MNNQLKAREMFLDAHKPLIAHIYNLPTDELKYDNTITEVMYKGECVGEVVTDFLKSKEGVERVFKFQKQYRNNLINILQNPTDNYINDWDVHMDYESIIMDKMINFNILPIESLIVLSGRTFFEQQRIFKLLHQGYQQTKNECYHERAQWFSQFDDKWYFKSCATRHRLIDILQQYTEQWEKKFVQQNKIEHKSLEDTYDEIKNIHRDMMVKSAAAENILSEIIKNRPEIKEYQRFVSASMEYNEELRLLRSRSVVSMIYRAKQDGKEPYGIFIDVIQTRKQRLKNEYN